MDKIKDKNEDNPFFWLRDALFSNPLERAKLHLGIAKNFFILFAFLYFFALLMTVGGSLVPYTAPATFFLYPLFVLSSITLFYNICSYCIVVYFWEKYLFLRYIVFIFFVVVFFVVLSIHLWAHTFLLSLLWTK